MKTLRRCFEYLDRNHIRYSHSLHAPAYTARDVAVAECMPIHEFVKTVVYSGDRGFGMVLAPGDYQVNLEEVRRILGLDYTRLATEAELANLFPDSELGAMPPLGNAVELPVIADISLMSAEFIAFNAGTHRDLIRLSFTDFCRIVNPRIAAVANRKAVTANA